MKVKDYIAGFLAALFMWWSLFLFGCATTPPTPFETGDEAPPLKGCVELRERNPDADC